MEKTWKTFYEESLAAFDAKEFDLAIAYGAAALQMPVEAIADQLPVYELMYNIFKANGDKRKAKEYLQACLGLEPSNSAFANEWFKNFEPVVLQIIPARNEFGKKISTTGADTEASKAEWFVVGLPDEPLSAHTIYALKVMTDNSKFFGDLGNGAYIVGAEFCKKMNIMPWDIMIHHFAKAYQHYICIQ